MDRTNYDDIQKMATRSEYIITGYDNIIQVPDFFIYEYILKGNYDKFNKFLKLDLFKNYSEKAMMPMMFKRTEKNILKWLSRENLSDQEYDDLYMSLHGKYKDMYSKLPFTDFAVGLKTILNQPTTQKLVLIVSESQYDRVVDKVTELFEKNSAKVSLLIANDTNDVFNKVSAIEEYSSFAYDDYDLIYKLIDQSNCISKSYLLPYNGYNFKIEDNVLISKKEFEFICRDKGCSIGFIEPITFNDSYYVLG